MRKLALTAFFALLLLVGCNEEKQPKALRITGNVEGLKKGTLYIQKLQDTVLVLLDSIPINGDSSFQSDIDLKSPEMLYLFMDRGATNNMDNSLMFFAEPGKMTIDTSLEFFYSKAKVTGSKNHKLYEEYKTVNSRFTNQQLELVEANMKAKMAGKTVSEEENNRKVDEIIKRKYLFAINFAINHKDAEIAPYIALAEINQATVKYLDTINKSLTPKVARSKYGKMLSEYIAERKKAEAQIQ